ncbi:MAG: tetratricopeptide repeat protein, partial [Trueperaceae bacterium]|nr:tetratricopeptide repeat protein [Trueperaceae bacterium]
MSPQESAPADATARAEAHDPLLALAAAGDWQTLARLGRFGLAGRTLRLAGGAEGGEDALDALEALAEVEVAVRAKAVARARRRFDGLERRPLGWLDWDAVASDLERLAVAVPAVDRREPETARAALVELRSDVFTAEREVLLGTLAVLEGDDATGLAHFEVGLARDPNHVRGLTNRGNAKLEAGDVDGAIEDYERAIRVDEGFANAHHNLGVAYRRKGQIGKSVAALRRAQR